MRGYVPPFRHVTSCPMFPGDWPLEIGLTNYSIAYSLPYLPDDAPDCMPAHVALATLLRGRIGAAGLDHWDRLAAHDVGVMAGDGVEADHPAWPMSISQAVDGLSWALASHSNYNYQWVGDIVCLLDVDADASPSDISIRMLVTVGRSSLAVKHALCRGYMVAAGLGITPDWHDVSVVSTGVVRTPPHIPSAVDGDCVMLVGWDDAKCAFECMFCGGSTWGENGMGWIPYTYILSSVWCHELVMSPLGSRAVNGS